MSESLLVSGALTSVEHGANIFLRLASTVIVTRLLSPEIFGLFAVIMTFQVIVELISDFGIRDTIIVTDEKDRDALVKTCWSVQIMRGFALYGVVLAIVLIIYFLQHNGTITGDSAYASEVLPFALGVSALQVPLRGFESINRHIYAKEMRFLEVTIYRMARSVLVPVLTIICSFLYPSVWALVIAGLVAGVLQLIVSYRIFDGPRMGWLLDRRFTGDIVERGKWIMGRSMLGVLSMQADRILLSAFLPAWSFGLYLLALQIVMIPMLLIQKLQNSFGLQFFRQIVDLEDKKAMQAKYYKYRLPLDFIACFFGGALISGGVAVIDLMYDHRYQDAGPVLTILAIGLPLRGLAVIREGFGAQKRFSITTWVGLVRTLTIWPALIIALAVYDSPVAAFVVVALHRIPELAVLLFLARREGWIDILREFRVYPVIAIGALAGWAFAMSWYGLKA